jgi:hypothetical protein
MEKIFKIVKKYLLSQPYVENGFEYQFILVDFDDIMVEFTVNVVLPKKGQSFTVDRFDHDISKIMENISRYVGERVVYMQHILVDGRPIPKSGVYINPEDTNEIIRSLNENIKKVGVYSKTPFESWVSANISFTPQKRDMFASAEPSRYVNIYLSYSLSNIKFNDEPVELDMKFVGEFATVFNDKILDEDSLRERIHDVLFRVLEPSLKIEDIEIYFNPEYWIDKVEGMEVDTNVTSSRDGFSYNMFKKTS